MKMSAKKRFPLNSKQTTNNIPIIVVNAGLNVVRQYPRMTIGALKRFEFRAKKSGVLLDVLLKNTPVQEDILNSRISRSARIYRISGDEVAVSNFIERESGNVRCHHVPPAKHVVPPPPPTTIIKDEE